MNWKLSDLCGKVQNYLFYRRNIKVRILLGILKIAFTILSGVNQNYWFNLQNLNALILRGKLKIAKFTIIMFTGKTWPRTLCGIFGIINLNYKWLNCIFFKLRDQICTVKFKIMNFTDKHKSAYLLGIFKMIYLILSGKVQNH